MVTITESLAIEHALLRELFAEMDRLLPEVRTVAEARRFSRLVEGVLSRHAEVEENLALAALDHALAERGQTDRLFRDHQEINDFLRRASQTGKLAEAVRCLQAGLQASREHFDREEQMIFPLLQTLFSPASLGVLAAGRTAPEVSGRARSRTKLPVPVVPR